MPNTELDNLFASLSTEAAIQRLIDDKTAEGLYLEFKTKKDRSQPGLDESDGWQFSRALSGFANSDGGILLWGIETNQHEQASTLKPISGVSGFQDRLKKSLLNSTQPVVDGVRIEAVAAWVAGEGYVKCLIPASDKTPHRAMLANREYYRRTIEGFYKLEHFDLEDMFGRRPRPILNVSLKLIVKPGDDPHEELHFSYLNSGRGIAKYVGFMCEFEDGISVAGVTGHLEDCSNLNNGRPIVSHQDNVGVVHPNGIATSPGHAILLRSNKGTPLSLRLGCYCENMQVRSVSITIAPGEEASTA